MNFYAIRIVGTDRFKISKHAAFGSFDDAMMMGCFFNQTKSAEKAIRDTLKKLRGEAPYSDHGSQYVVNNGGVNQFYTPSAKYAEMVGVELKPIELEVVTLSMIVTA